MSRLEAGQTGLRVRDLHALLDIYGVTDPDVRSVFEASRSACSVCPQLGRANTRPRPDPAPRQRKPGGGRALSVRNRRAALLIRPSTRPRTNAVRYRIALTVPTSIPES